MQGHLRKENLTFRIATTCVHCGQAIHIQMDGDLRYTVEEAGAAPLVFVPMVDFEKLEDPSIIDAF